MNNGVSMSLTGSVDDSLIFLLASFLVTCLPFFAIGRWLDGITNETAKREVSSWLLNAQQQRVVCGWANAFAHSFDAIFGARHVSLKCFIRSVIASVTAVGLCSLLAASVSTVSSQFPEVSTTISGWSDILDLLLFGFIAVSANIIIDYASLLETRIAVDVIRRQRRLLGRCMVLLGDFVFTFLGSAVIFLVIMTVFSVIDIINDAPSHNLIVVILKAKEQLFTELFFGRGFWGTLSDVLRVSEDEFQNLLVPFLWSTYFTSVWLWLIVVAGIVNRIGSGIGVVKRFAVRYLKIEEKPFSFLAITCWLLLVAVTIVGKVV